MNNEYLVSVFLDPVPVEARFVQWPLHITLMPWFRTEYGPARVASDVAAMVSGTKPFKAYGVTRSRFGAERNIMVTEVDSPELQALHGALSGMFDKGGYGLIDPKYTGANYRPHVTKKGISELEPGNEVTVDAVYVVSAPPENPRTRTKTVMARIALSDP